MSTEESPLEIMKEKIKLTDEVELTNARVRDDSENINVIVDYSKLYNNVPTLDDLRRETPSLATNFRWETIQNDIGGILAQRIIALGGSDINSDDANKLRLACENLSNRINEILKDDGKQGLKNIFKHKSQYFDTTTKKKSCSGPKDFFRFLFNFAVPPEVNIRSIFEIPGAGGSSGQCWQVYGNNVLREGYKHPPTWGDNKRMHCYICDIPLSLTDGENPKNMQCEHLFPFTEAQLFWVLNSNAIKANSDYKDELRDIQVREYAPVCAHCNCTLKSALGILKLNDDWLEGNVSEPIVKKNEDSISKIAGEYDRVRHQNTSSNLNGRKNRLNDVFDPLITAINTSLKNRGIDNPKKLSKFLIYKYLFYIDDNVLSKLKVVFIGGQNLIKLNKERKQRNGMFYRMLKKIEKCIKTKVSYETAKLEALETAVQEEVEARKNFERTTRERPKENARKTVLEMQEKTLVAEREATIANQEISRYKNKLMSFFRRFHRDRTPDSERIIEDMKQKIINDEPNTDYMKSLNLTDDIILSEFKNIVDDVDSDVLRGGSKKGEGNSYINDATEQHKNVIAKALLVSTIAMSTLNESKVDYGLILYCLKDFVQLIYLIQHD